MIKLTSFTAWLTLCLNSAAFAFCPTEEDVRKGIIVHDDNGSDAYVKLRDDDTVWIGMGRGGRTPTPENAFIRVFDRGILLIDAPSNFPTWTHEADLTQLADLTLGEKLVVEGMINSDGLGEPRHAKVRFRFDREDTDKLGGCDYYYRSYQGITTISMPDGTEKKDPGFFYYVPELSLPVFGIWNGSIRRISEFRRAPETAWFGD